MPLTNLQKGMAEKFLGYLQDPAVYIRFDPQTVGCQYLFHMIREYLATGVDPDYNNFLIFAADRELQRKKDKRWDTFFKVKNSL